MQVDWYWVSMLPTAMWSVVLYLPLIMICFAGSLILPLPWEINRLNIKMYYIDWLLFATVMTTLQTGMCLLAFGENDWTFDERLCIYFNLGVFSIAISYIILMITCLTFKRLRKTKVFKVIIRFMTYLICWWGALELFILPNLLSHYIL